MDATDPYLLYIPVALIVAVIAVYWALIGREARLVVGALSVAAAAQLAWVALVGGGTAHAFAILPCLITLTMMVAVVPDTMTVGRWMAAIAVPWAVLSIFVLRPTLTDLDPPTMVAPPATDTRRFTTRGDGPGRPYIESKRAAMVLMTGEPHPVGHGAHERAVAFDLGRRVAAETASSGPFFAVSTSPDGQGQATYVRFPGPEPDRTTVVSASPGLASAGSDGRVDVTDAFGVVDSFGPRVWGQARHTALGPALPLAWTIARYSPTGTVVPESLRGPYLGEQIVEDARRSLRCAPLSDLDAAITSEVSASRLLRNLVASASLTWTRVPASPGRGC